MPKQHLNRFIQSSSTNVVSQGRNLVKDARAQLNVHESQSFMVDDDHSSRWMYIPSQNNVNFGSYSTFNLDLQGHNLEQVILLFQASAISGYTGGTTSFVPATFWSNRIELATQSGTICDTLQPTAEFLNHNLFSLSDEQRIKTNVLMGRYDNNAQRQALASTTSYYAHELFSVFQQSPIPVLNNQTSYQLRVYMRPLSEVVEVSGGSGTPSANIISCVALCKVSKIPRYSQALVEQYNRVPHHIRFNDTIHMSITQASGVSQSRHVLSGITGNISYLVFVVRPTAQTGSNLYTFTGLNGYELLDGASESLVGGQQITDLVSRNIHGKSFSPYSSYLAETGSHAYLWSFSKDAMETATTGNNLGSYPFRGNEILQLYYTGSLSSSVQIDIYAHRYAVLEVRGSSVKKLSV